MILRPPRSTLSSSSAASDVYKRQDEREQARMQSGQAQMQAMLATMSVDASGNYKSTDPRMKKGLQDAIAMSAKMKMSVDANGNMSVSYTHLRAHETPEHLV
eukprot:TRINITY_DN39899_c0_g1_i1.p1 TRINITY_DN39899_c0_g1~~TRINITY_DN39899_c0_g1_i1.p1  ORF type:complete len:102 (-),score=36.96 TRINITY_DN39899_c0_g1_i1:69-374(-)